MLADFFTKPLQGNLLRFFRGLIMGESHIGHLNFGPTTIVEERVDESDTTKVLGLNPKMSDDVSSQDPTDDGWTVVRSTQRKSRASGARGATKPNETHNILFSQSP
jgi:hypothetical protein